MVKVLLLGCGDAAVAAELEAAGHAVRMAPFSAVPAEALGDSPPDVAVLRPNALPPAGVARRFAVEAPATAIVVVLDAADARDADAVLDAGATDVAVEPLTGPGACALVARAVRDARARVRLKYLQGRAAHGAELRQVIGDSPAMRSLFDALTRLARRSSAGPPVRILLTGETGTGKNLLARVFHFSSNRRDEPFVEVNCAALPGTLVEAELFGYERGAFTDARASRAGLFEAAHGGTLFLDEVTCLGLDSQAKLLTALESGRIRRLGSSEDRCVDVQVIAATSQDVPALVAKGQMRPELYHRLSAFSFVLPPLRERGDDAVAIAERFTEEIARSYGLARKRLSDAARTAVRAYRWPGNVRELHHAVERAVLGEEGETVEARDLRLDTTAGAQVAVDASGRVAVSLPETGVALEDVELALMRRALAMTGGNVTRAASLLRVSRDTLRYRLEKFGIAPGSFAEE